MNYRDLEEIIDTLSMSYYGDFLERLQWVVDGLDFLPEDILQDEGSVRFEYTNRLGDTIQFTLFEEDDHVESYMTTRHDPTTGEYDYEKHNAADFINDKVRELYAKR